MKLILVLFVVLLLSGCGDTKVIEGIEYDTYGIFNSTEQKNPNIKYRIIFGNVVWSIILSETLIAPIYFVGFSIYEPVGIKNSYDQKGVIYHE